MDRQFLIVLRDPGHLCEPNWICLAERFGLTQAELRLCIALTKDLSIAEYSEKFHISPHTAFSQLKRIFEKTATHSQIQLHRLIFAFVHS
jgi:DNA-binding CsgD family transcriptional regulator